MRNEILKCKMKKWLGTILHMRVVPRAFLISLFSFLISHFSFLISKGYAQPMHHYSLGFTVNYGNAQHFTDTIPITFDEHRILLPVKIGGKEYHFLFDTGATQGAIFTGSRLPYIKEVGNVISFDINNRPDTVRVVQLPTFQLGGLTIDGYLATVIKSGLISRSYDGIIGFDLINKGLACKIDVENKRMILTDRKKFFAGEEGYEVKYKLQSFVPYVWVSPFMRHMDCALFDTGFRNLYTMNRESFQKHVYKSRQVAAQVEDRAIGQSTIGMHSVETADTVYFLALDRLKWDEFVFRNYHTITQEGSSHIGAELLDYGSVIINPFKKRMVFQPYNKSGVVRVDNQQFQMYIVPINNRPTIGLIRQGSDAYKNGLRQGDTIIKVNGRDIPNIVAFQQLSFVKGHTYTYTVRRTDGTVHQVQILK